MKAAVLLGLPATQAEFDHRIAGDGASDFLRPHVRARGASRVWAGSYARIVDALQALIAAIEPGVRVVRGATLHDLREISGATDVLVVFAHWKGARYAEDDIHRPLDELLLAARQRDDSASLAVASKLAELASLGESTPTSIVRSLNELIAPASSPLDRALPEQAKWHTAGMRKALRRDLVDDVLEALVQPGNSLELFDGLHAPGCIEGAIDPGFSGTLELATCNSDLLGLCIENGRDQRIRLLQNDFALLPVPRCHIVRHALAYVLQHPEADYARTRLAIERGLGPRC